MKVKIETIFAALQMKDFWFCCISFVLYFIEILSSIGKGKARKYTCKTSLSHLDF